MITKLLLAVAILVAMFLSVVALQPGDYRITRTELIPASPAAVFAQVNDLQRWRAWSPWEKIDPDMKRTFEGPAAGRGATYAWEGNNEVGSGRMRITESEPPERIRISLEFIKPFASTSVTEFTFKPEGGQTLVTWTMTGTNNFVARLFALFMNMDRMVGGQFEQGLAALKGVVAGPARSSS